MTMPFFESTNNPNIKIDYSKCQPVSVIAAFNREGKILPVYIGLMDLYGMSVRLKSMMLPIPKTEAVVLPIVVYITLIRGRNKST